MSADDRRGARPPDCRPLVGLPHADHPSRPARPPASGRASPWSTRRWRSNAPVTPPRSRPSRATGSCPRRICRRGPSPARSRFRAARSRSCSCSGWSSTPPATRSPPGATGGRSSMVSGRTRQDLWARLDVDDQRRLFRHLAAFWSVHRHRMAGEAAERIARLREDGRLAVAAARIVAIRQAPRGVTVALRRRGERTVELVPFDWVVNCSGAGRALSGEAEPILRQAIALGLARPDACQSRPRRRSGRRPDRPHRRAECRPLRPRAADRRPFLRDHRRPRDSGAVRDGRRRPRRLRRGGKAHGCLASPRHRFRLRPLTLAPRPRRGRAGARSGRIAAQSHGWVRRHHCLEDEQGSSWRALGSRTERNHDADDGVSEAERPPKAGDRSVLWREAGAPPVF